MAFDLRMRALHCAQQSGNSASNPEQAIRFIPTHFADSERHCSAAANQDGDETDEKNNPERAPWLQCWHCPPLPSRTMRVTAAAASSTCLPLSMVDQPRPAARPSPPCRRARVHVMHEAHAGEQALSPNDPYTVYDESGSNAGRDPDPNVRFELHRDNAHDE